MDRVKAETLNVSVGDVFNVLSGYIGSAYVNQFNKFGRTYQVYVQADAKYRLEQRDIEHLWVRSKNNNIGAARHTRADQAQCRGHPW